MERRYFKIRDLEFRADPDGVSNGTIAGYAVVFDSLSEDFGDFREIVRPGAFDRTLAEASDVRAFWNHNTDLILGRETADTLSLAVDEVGLRFEITPPDSPNGQNAAEAVRRGDVSQMSFGFTVEQDQLSTQEDGSTLRELLDVSLFEVSPVVFPAYPETSAEVRSQQVDSELRSRIEEFRTQETQEPDREPNLLKLKRLKLELYEKQL